VLGVTERIFQHLHGKISERDEEKFRIAALLHDIGHFPLSHTTEQSYDKISGKIKPDDLQPKDPKKQEKMKESSKKGSKPHEKMGAYIVLYTNQPGGITKILKDNGFDDAEISEIAHIITGSHPNILFNQLMHSDLDVDRIDYMNRDAKNSGIIYGMFDSEYLIESMELIDKPGSKHKILCIKAKGLGALEDFFFARYHYYTKIIFHRVCFFFDKIAQIIYGKLIELGMVYSIEQIEKMYVSGNRDEIIAFNDDYFFKHISKCKDEKRCVDINIFIDVILFRQRCDIVKEKQFWVTKEDKKTIKNNLDKFKKENCAKVSSVYFDPIQDDVYFQFCETEKELEMHESGAFEDGNNPIYDLRDPVRLLLDAKVAYTKKADTKIYGEICLENKPYKLVALCNYDQSLLSELSKKQLNIFRCYDTNKIG
jgi:hypothetical protein